MGIDAKSFNGDFTVHRKGDAGQRRHKSYRGAETEAGRLAERFPETTFVIQQEVGRVKVKKIGGPIDIDGKP